MVLKGGIRNDFKPFSFSNERGEKEGIIHDYLNLISEKTGLKFKYEINTEEELLKKLKNKEIDFIPVLSNYGNTVDFNFSTPYFQINESLLNVNHSNNIFDENFFNDKISHLLISKDLILSNWSVNTL